MTVLQGILAKHVIYTEAAFGTMPATPAYTRVELQSFEPEVDYGYKEPETISGTLVPAADVRTRKTVKYSTGMLAAPENGFEKLLKYITGAVTTVAGYFRSEWFTADGAETSVTLAFAPITATSESLYFFDASAGTWALLTRVASGPSTGEYSINNTSGVASLGFSLAAGDKILSRYCEVVSGVYSHVYTASVGTLPSFGVLENLPTDLDVREVPGGKVNSASMTIGSEDFLAASLDIMAQEEALGSETGHTFPAGTTMSNLQKFLFKDAAIYINGISTDLYESLDIAFENNLDEAFTIRCADTVRDLAVTKQRVGLSGSLLFEDLVEYNRVRNGTFFMLEVVYGLCHGEEIGTTDRNYGLHFWATNVRHQSGTPPTQLERMRIDVEGFANPHPNLDNKAYEIVLINTIASIA